MYPHGFVSFPFPYPPIPAHVPPDYDPNQHPYPQALYPQPIPYPPVPQQPSIDVVLNGATPSSAQSTPDDRPSDSTAESQYAEQSASPSSPPQPGSSAGATGQARPRAKQRESWVPPPPPPPLNDPIALMTRSRMGLEQLLSQGNIDARPSRQVAGAAPRSGACTGCRLAKARCSQDEPQCTRCLMMKQDCAYPLFNKRGRKRAMTPNQMMLQNCYRDLEKAMALIAHAPQGAAADPSAYPSSSYLSPPVASTSQLHAHGPSSASSSNGGQTDPNEDEDADARELKSVIESPLAVLAHISSLKVSESTEEESGKTFLPKGRQAQGSAAEGYFATGLYQLRSDADPSYDPVLLGMLSDEEFELVVQYYFTHLRPFFFHLSAELHTPRFLRQTSPFLSTTLAYLCAAYIPPLHDRVQALHDHTLRLSDRVWSEGLKSLEIVQAYLLLIHWTPIENDWGDDRRWGWLGQALRIATEIKLHKTINTATYDFYRSVTPLGDGAYQLLAEARAWSWKLLFVAEIALCVSTGRLGSVHTLPLSTPGAPLPQDLQPSDAYYDVAALVSLNRIYAKAITHSNALQDHEEGHESRLRPEFQKAWQRDMSGWSAAWPGIGPLIRLIAQHNTTILTSISLRFKGPVAPVLEECRVSAFETAKMAVNWRGDGINWMSNILIVNIAYAATLLLRLAAAKPGPIDQETKLLCAAVADVLLRMGAMRPTVRTLATLHGTRIRTLLQADLPKHTAPPASTPSGALISSPSAPNALLLSTTVSPSTAPYPPFSSTSTSQLLPTQALLQAQEAGLAPAALPNVFNLPPTDSHMLWNLFHETPALPLPLPDPAPHPAAAPEAQAEPLQPGRPVGPPVPGAPFQPDDWVYKSTLDQDWLSSEPGAWAW